MQTVCVFDSNFEDVVNTLGFTRLGKYKAVKLWRQIESRLALLDKFRRMMNEYHRTYWQSRLNSSSARMRFRCYFNALNKMQTYTLACRTQLDTNNTIDTYPLGDLSFSWEPAETDSIFLHRVQPLTSLYKHFSEFIMTYTEDVLWDMYKEYCPRPVGWYDKAAQLLTKGTYMARRSSIMGRLQWELRVRHMQGWYMVFDTLTLSPDQQARFHEKQHNMRDYFRDVSWAVMRAEGRNPRKEKSDDCYSYFCVPEYGKKTDRLHFHVIHFMRTLPKGSVDPNQCRPGAQRRQLDSMRGLWSFGFSQPIAIRYSQDAFTRAGWRWPTDKEGNAIPCKPYQAVGFYVTKYVCKNVDVMMFDALKRAKNQEALNREERMSSTLSAEEMQWLVNNVDIQREIDAYGDKSCPQTNLEPTMNPKQRNLYRVRMSRHLGTASIPMQDLSVNGLLELTKLHYSITPYSAVLKRQALKQLAIRMSGTSIKEIRAFVSQRPNLLKSLRNTMRDMKESNLPNSMCIVTPVLAKTDVSDEVRKYLEENSLFSTQIRAEQGQSRTKFGSK